MIRRDMRARPFTGSLVSIPLALILAAPASAAEVARIHGASLDGRDDRGAGFCGRFTSTVGAGTSNGGPAP